MHHVQYSPPSLKLWRVRVVNVQCSVLNVQCSMFSAQCSVLNVQCSMFSAQCSVLNVQCSMFSAQCSVLNVGCHLLAFAKRRMLSLQSSVGSLQSSVGSLRSSVLSRQFKPIRFSGGSEVSKRPIFPVVRRPISESPYLAVSSRQFSVSSL
jgi:hypothetical protein